MFRFFKQLNCECVNMEELENPAVVKHCFVPWKCYVFTPSVLQRATLCQGWVWWMEVIHSCEETPPIESTVAECAGLNKTGAKGFVFGSLPSSSPRIPGNQVWLLEPACRECETQRPLYFIADVQRHGSLWEQKNGWGWGASRDFQEGLLLLMPWGKANGIYMYSFMLWPLIQRCF